MADKPSFLDAYSPWSSRSTTPKSGTGKPAKEQPKEAPEKVLPNQTSADHVISNRQFPSAQDYPKEAPRLNTRWFYATDSPKRKAPFVVSTEESQEPPPKPKKYSVFSARDSYALEAAFQKLLEEDRPAHPTHRRGTSVPGKLDSQSTKKDAPSVKVPVNEDFLFDVDIENRELGPAYWLGPIYDVRRGSWFYQDGSNLRPCDENLAGQLEQGYLKIKPWQSVKPVPDEAPNPKSRPTSISGVDGAKKDEKKVADTSNPPEAGKEEPPVPAKFENQTQRLFGTYMNSVVTYQDATTAWLLTDDFLSRMSSTVYQRFAGGGHLGGTKVVRGFTEVKPKETKKDTEATDKLKSEAPDASKDEDAERETSDKLKPTSKLSKLERQMSNLDPATQEAEAREIDEEEMRQGYRQADGEDQGREIEHLVLVTHGIGQKLGARLEMLNFISDINLLRKTLKMVYQNAPDLQLLNSEVENPKNSRLQVLPIVWRHQVDFPKQNFKHNKEQDVADAADDEEYPSLESISLEPATIIRTAIRDLGLDILMYQSAYREHISETVVRECNRVYSVFKARNPGFQGKVSMIGHSLGSAIMFDVLSQQEEPRSAAPRSRTVGSQRPAGNQSSLTRLDFDVEDYYCLGSPLGLYQMLNGRKIVGRRSSIDDKSWDGAPIEDPFLGSSSKDSVVASDADLFAISKSTPKCKQLFNIFHPADPVAYRLEPLISTAMSSLKPQPLPYTKKGIFDVQGQGLSAIGNRVGQSVSDLWSSVTGGMASSLLNRTLGLPAEQTVTKASAPQVERKPDLQSLGADGREEDFQAPPTLIDNELETLYAGFEKRRRLQQSDQSRDLGESSQWMDAEKRSRRLRREEAKVRALNSNGRVDFVIQTGVFDLTNPMTSIASHLSYWSDEDVCHFMISQLLARQRVVKK